MENDEARIQLLARVAKTTVGANAAAPKSILSLSAAAYGARPSDESTVPTGFDPQAVALFESIVEGAYLVAAADGVVDADELKAFERVVVAACGGAVTPKQVHALMSDLADQLGEDGIDRRIASVASPVQKKEQAREVLRIAALLADASEGVSAVERDVLGKLAAACGLEVGEVDSAIADVRAALAAAATH